MKQSTSFAQVATNLLTVLQRYTKGIRFVAVLTVLLTMGIGQAWGADTWTWTANSGDFGSENPGTETGTVTLNEKSWSYSRDQAGHLGWGNSSIQFGSKNNPENVTLSTSAFSSYTITSISVKASSYNGAHKLTIKVGDATVKSATTLPAPTSSPNAISTGTISKKGDIRLEFSNKLRALYIQSITVTYEEAATVPVTGVRLNKSTLTLTEGGSETLTATILPNDATNKNVSWSSDKTAVATVSDNGLVTAVGEGEATITVTTEDGNKTATCNVIVNPKPKYTVTWDVNGDQSVTTQVTEGSKPTFPVTPSSCDATSNTFYGWATATWDGKIDNISEKTIYTSANNMPAVNGAVTYYAVFATKGAGGGTAFDGTSGGDFKIYALVEGEKKYLKGTGSKISPVEEAEATEYTFTKISDGVFSIKTGTTYLTYASSTNLGTSNSSYSWNISEGTKGSWRIASATDPSRGIVYRASTYHQFGGYSTGNIKADGTEYYDVEIGGGSSVSYSGYITTCTTSYSVTSTLSHVTADAENPESVLESAEDLTLAYLPEDGWNLPATISVTMGGTPLSSETDYDWDNGDLLIAPASGFTGDIVVTINGWQQLATPTGLNVTNITSTSATLSWGEVANASSYLLTIVDGGDLSADIPNTQTSHTFEGLTPSTEYLWTVKAIGDGITYTNSEESETGEFTTSSATCTVTYDENEGIGTPPSDANEYTNGATVTVLGNYGNLTRDGYAFIGWNTKADGSGDSYKHNDQFTIRTNITLYAQWCEAYWKLVTDESELENDTRIVIAAKDYKFALSTTQNTNNRGQAEITKKYNTSTFGADVQTLSLVGLQDDKFALLTGNGYLYAASSSNNYLKTKVTHDNNCYWSIGISETVASIYAQGDNSHNQIKYNHQQNGQLFSCYERSNTSMSAVVIYKEVCVRDQYNVTSNLTNATANTNPTTVDADATSLTLNYSANTGYLLPETITVKMGGVELLSGTNYNWNKETGTLTITVTGFYGDIDVTIEAEEDPCFGFAMSEVTATSTTNSITLSWTAVEGATSYNVTLNPGDFSVSTGNTSHTFEELSPKTTYNWEVQAVKGTCQASKTGSTTTQKESFTITWLANGQEHHVQTNVEGTAIEIPAEPEATTYACDDKEFVGWIDQEISGSTNEEPDFITDFGNVEENKTYYAVFATPSGNGFTLGQSGDFTIYANVDGTNYYATGKIGATNNGKIVGTTEEGDANVYTFTAISGNNESYTYNIKQGDKFLKYDSSTDLASTNDSYTWTISQGTKGSWRIAASTNGRAIIFRYDSKLFGGYATSNFSQNQSTYYDIEIGGATTYTEYVTSCVTCENVLTIIKGNEENGTFTLDKVGEQKTCDGLSVLVTPTPAEHYHVFSVTASTGETAVNNGDGTYTITYAANSTGESTINVTFEEDAKASITLSELGVENTDNTTYYVGETYTLPSTSSQSCAGKQLVGWSTVEVVETDTKPTENYYELGAKVTLAETQTFYAVFAAGSGGGSTEATLTFDDTSTRTTRTTEQQVWEENGITLTNNKAESTTAVGDYAAPARFYANSQIIISAPGAITQIVADCDESKYATALVSSVGANASASGTTATITPTTQSETYEITLTGQTRFNSITVTYGGGAYTAYTTSCIPTYSITYDFAGGTGSHCSNTSVPQGDSYTICDEAPTKEGHTFLGWSDGINTYQPNNSFTPTSDITLTAQWQVNTYTVTWSNNGVTTPVTYEHGDELEVLAAPESCDGVKEFVGWTEDNTFTYHATTPPSDIFTEKTATVTADATYYAVFATPPGTGGGGGGSETTTTLDFTAQGYANETAINKLTVDGVTATFDKGSNSNAPKYYTNGTAIRAYGGNTITLSANQITAATFTFGSSDGSNGITADCGSWESPTWTGDATDEVVFTISGSSGNRRIQSIAVTYTSGGGSGSYSDYTTTCQQVESIEVQNPQTEFYLTNDFTIGEGKVMATLSDGITKVDVTSLATFSGYNMEVVGTYTVTVTYMGATATYNINVKPLDNAWVLTWNVSGKTNTGLGPRYVNKGSAIGTLPTPEVPAACEGKTFMGWTESNIVPSDGVGIEYIKPTTVPTDNTTYYAVFAIVNNFCTQKPIDQIASGSKVVIVAVASLTDDGGAGKAISSRATDDTYNLQGDDVAIYDQTINTPHSTCIWTINKSDGKYIFTQDGKYLNGIIDGNYSNLKYNSTSDSWSLSNAASGMAMTYNMKSTNASTEYVEWYNEKFTIHNEVNENGDFDMQFYVTANADGNADITDYTTGCEEYTITYYGFRGGYSTSTSSDGIIVLPVNSLHTVPDCGDVVTDHTNLGREFLNVWMTEPHGGHTFKPGDTFILTQDTTLYAQWKLETTSDVTTLPTDIEDMAGTDIYVYGGKTLNIQPGTTTINSLTLKGGLQSDGSYKMPIVWVPEGATLVRNSNKIYLDLVVNAKNYYPFAVPFATKNDQYIDYLDPDLNAASTYDKHFVIKTYDGALRATNGEDRANNWVKVLRHQSAEEPSYLQPGVGYIIQALTYPDKDTATIRIPMTVPNTWFENGEQAVVGTTVRNTIAVTAHGGAAATEHKRHAGWNFVASPYLTNFAGSNVENDGGLEYIKGELTVNGGWQYGGDEVPYVTIPAYDFSYYTQHKLSDVKLSPEWSFFVQIGTSGAMNFSTDGRQEIPASIAARHDAAQSIRMDVDIVLSDKHHSDQMGLIICDRFTSAYEIGYDLEKMFGSAYNLTVYTLMEDNTPLAYQALAIHSNMQVIPVGYRVPEQGDYTFALNQSTSSIDLLNEQYEQLILVDYETGALTNLLNSSYTFTSPRTQSNSRFAIYAVMRQDIPTDLPNIDDGDTSTRKILHNGHLYILRDGKVYNGHGQIVKQ